MTDIFETLWAMGVPSSDMTDLSAVEPFRVSTVGERLMFRKTMEDVFNVPQDGFVENPWGFPFIPLPKNRQVSAEGLFIAPNTISFEGLGHPIFWIDPALTRRTDEEKAMPERWNIRMFYLIMALDMFQPTTLRWYNVPRTQGIEYTREDWLAYQQGTTSILSSVRPLTEADLVEPLDVVNEHVEIALARCAESQSVVWSKYRAELDAAYSAAVASTQGRSEWDVLDREMKDTIAKVVAVVEKGGVPSSYVGEIYRQVAELERIVQHCERCAIVLSIPVINSSSDNGARVAAAATAINASTAIVDINVDALKVEAHKLFELSANSNARDFVRLHETATAVYMKSWRALGISARNLVRASEGKNAYQSWEAFELVEGADTTVWPPLSQVLSSIGR